jgi:AAA15 family ATPase/GTPase
MLNSKSLFIPKVIVWSILHLFYEEGEIDFQNLSYVSEEIFKMNEIPLEPILSPMKLEETLSKLKSTKLEEDLKIKLDVEKTIKKYEIEKIERFQDQFVIFKDGSAIPLDILGDGFLQMISILYYLIKCKEIALLDEPTAFMHPDYIRKFVEYLIDVVKDKSMQIFISTHNIDLLETFLDFGEDDSFVKDNLKIIRLTRVNGDIRAKELGFKEALEESEELYTDLRGI